MTFVECVSIWYVLTTAKMKLFPSYGPRETAWAVSQAPVKRSPEINIPYAANPRMIKDMTSCTILMAMKPLGWMGICSRPGGKPTGNCGLLIVDGAVWLLQI